MATSKFMRVEYSGKLVTEDGVEILSEEFTTVLGFEIPNSALEGIHDYRDLWIPIAQRALLNVMRSQIPQKPWIDIALTANRNYSVKITQANCIMQGTVGWRT